MLDQLPQALEVAPSPRCYEFVRLRYLITEQYATNDYLIALGKRLLQQDGDDYDVCAYLARDIMPMMPEGEKQALHYANELVRMRPKSGRSHRLLGLVYSTKYVFKNDHNPDDARQAIAHYRKALELERPGTPLYKETKAGLESLQKSLARLSRG